ncbi:ABC transporter permease [Nonomuraea sp. NPDC050451]|uniref:ABC transporter permease n=1 Tax=Nonomuraea sp. NPDC050451 TaxID=3364364 RepID=UPI0037A6AF4D
MALRNTVAAEVIKLVTLPAALAAVCGTVLVPAGLAAVLAAGPPSAMASAFRSVDYAQAGLLVLGVLSVASEYAGSQIRTTLTAVPGRMPLMAGKLVAYLVVASFTALLTVTGAVLAARLADGAPPPDVDVAGLLRAAAYLVLIGLLGAVAATLTREVVAALGAALVLVLILPPVLGRVTTLADYLPGAAGARMYQQGPGLTPVEGGLVLGAWLAVGLAGAALAFARRDA